jgi:hypothetical protein
VKGRAYPSAIVTIAQEKSGDCSRVKIDVNVFF